MFSKMGKKLNDLTKVTNPNECDFLRTIMMSAPVTHAEGISEGTLYLCESLTRQQVRYLIDELKRERFVVQSGNELKKCYIATPDEIKAADGYRENMLAHNIKSIIAIDESGKETLFPSVASMCDALSLSKCNVYRVMRGETKRLKGYTFRYADNKQTKKETTGAHKRQT
ncbi:MAG: hypothetical protein ACRCX4_09295 [Bacteroidales bacterium]